MAGKKGVQRRAWTPEDVARLRELAGKVPLWRACMSQELETLRALAGVVPAAVIARRLGRTAKAVQTQDHFRGLSLKVWGA
jgi:hypothetical protein